MKRPVKIGIGIVAALVVVVAAAVIFLFASLDTLIEAAVEDIGSEATQARVELDQAEISPTSGVGVLRSLTVGNPKGFKTPIAFKLGEISVKLDIATVTEDVIVIKEIIISKPQVTYEIGPDGTNIDAIKKNVNDFAGEEKTEAKKSGGKSEGPKIIIEHLYIRGGKVNVSASALGGKTLTAPLPNLHLTDIGKEEGGTGPGEAIEEVIDALTKSIGKSVATLNLDSVLGIVEGGAKGAVGAIEEGVKGVGGVVEEGAKGLGSAVKGLFGGDK